MAMGAAVTVFPGVAGVVGLVTGLSVTVVSDTVSALVMAADSVTVAANGIS